MICKSSAAEENYHQNKRKRNFHLVFWLINKPVVFNLEAASFSLEGSQL